MTPSRGRLTVVVLAAAAVLVVAGAVLWPRVDDALTVGTALGRTHEPKPWAAALSAPTVPTRESAGTAAPTSAPTPAFDLAQHSSSDPASPWVVVNKQHPLPADHVPPDIVEVEGVQVRGLAAADLTAMLTTARAEGVALGVRSGYRSYDVQAAARADIEARRGFAHAERYSARPGHSEHQTGLAVDVVSGSTPSCDLQTCFATTPEGTWVAARAGEFGFVVRYTEQNTDVTGYAPEGWHLRWVGRELTAWLAANGTPSLEEALGVTGGPEYVGG
ncbi:M15 family metallopeptidase [Cellulomonas shaoxiangyii]|uniref:D-alanyl-D-alanine carboxypeptidase family protein n=1 Tax=Cellulomonas shaoxiangyii TaxID=2566013 RepID=A0A4P7SHP7_9CELL|nr:M15 family metallopeptidase [Cellulomonas shaoxiangyii]QCB92646.1 D-alanyl-D-alanine carboxypeptidase family protein [Cellulomonas shaoxiangyii]TGY85454.1 D-alanyl-D-alanine carboxypeptidase family protein [Cellulomonas shaoxiangyii]